MRLKRQRRRPPPRQVSVCQEERECSKLCVEVWFEGRMRGAPCDSSSWLHVTPTHAVVGRHSGVQSLPPQARG
jgi:hypothetical protein